MNSLPHPAESKFGFIFVVLTPIVVPIDMYLLAEGSMRTILVPMETSLWSDVTYGSVKPIASVLVSIVISA